jgi:hypothetical protein
MLCHR